MQPRPAHAAATVIHVACCNVMPCGHSPPISLVSAQPTLLCAQVLARSWVLEWLFSSGESIQAAEDVVGAGLCFL